MTWNHHASAAARGYGSEWTKLRAIVLAEEPTCRNCQAAPSQHADHIVPKAKGGSDDRSNLQGLCALCHYRKTGQESGRRSNKREPEKHPGAV